MSGSTGEAAGMVMLMLHSIDTAQAEQCVDALYQFIQRKKEEFHRDTKIYGDGNAAYCLDELEGVEKKLIEICDIMEFEYPDDYDCGDDDE